MKLRKLLALLLTLAMVLPMAVPALSVSAAEDATTELPTEIITGDASVEQEGESVFYQTNFSDETVLADFDLYQSADSKFGIVSGEFAPDGTSGEQKAILKQGGKIKSLSVNIIPGESGVIYGGVYFGAKDAQNGQDQINSQVILIKSDYSGWSDAANRIDIVYGQFNSGWKEIKTTISETGKSNNLFSGGVKEPLNLRLDFSYDLVLLTLSLASNSSKYLQVLYEIEPELIEGQVGLRNIGSDTRYDKLIVNHDYIPETLTQGMKLDGTGVKSHAKTLLPVGEKPVTIEAWVKMENNGTKKRQAIISNYTGGSLASNSKGTWGLYTDEDGDLWYTELTSGGTYNQTERVEMWTGQWTHVAIVRGQGVLSVYANGELVIHRENAKIGESNVLENYLTIGYCTVGSGSTQGEIGDIRLWSTERTQEQIQDNMYRELTGKEEGLMQHWNFDSHKEGVISNTVEGGVDLGVMGHAQIGDEGIYRWDFSDAAQLEDFTYYYAPDYKYDKYDNVQKISDEKLFFSGSINDSSTDVKAVLNQEIDNITYMGADVTQGGTTNSASGMLFGIKNVNSNASGDYEGFRARLGRLRTSKEKRPWGEIDFYKANGSYKALTSLKANTTFFPGPDTKLPYHIQITFEGNTANAYMYRLDDPTITNAQSYTFADGELDGQVGLWHGRTSVYFDNLVILTDMSEEEPPVQDESVIYNNDGYNFMNSGSKTWEMKQDITTPYTMEAWIKVPAGIADGTTGYIVGNPYRAPHMSMQIVGNGNLRLGWTVENADLTKTTTNYDVAVDLRSGLWTHVAYTCDVETDTITAYINGQVMKTWTNANVKDMILPDHISPDNLFAVGSKKTNMGASSNLFPGWIADVRLWDRALSETEIQSSMMTQYTTAKDGLVFNAPLNEITDNKFVDLSGNGYDLQQSVNSFVLETQEHEPGSYSMIVIPDQQILSHYYQAELMGMYQWIADNREKENIQIVMNVGDLADNCGNIAQWDNNKAAWELLPKDLPFITAAGNHDYDTNSGWNKGYGVREQLTIMNSYFPQSIFEAYPTEIGFFDETNSVNQWQAFSVNGNKYLVMALEYVPQADVLEWAGQVADEHPNHQVIMVTHSFMGNTGNLDQPKIWNDFLKNHENVIMTFSGHVSHTEVVHRTDKGVSGNDVHNILMDAQSLDTSNRKHAMIGILRFSADGTQCDVSYYSTDREMYEARSNFTLSLPKQEHDYTAMVGNKCYSSVTQAIAEANGGIVKLLKSTDEAVTVSTDAYVDLAGLSLGHVTVAEGATFYGMDSATDDYDCADGYGKIAGITGDHAPYHRTVVNGNPQRYLAVAAEDDSISFHRFYIGIQSVSLKPGATGFGYKAIFGGDTLVKTALDENEAFGYKLWIDPDHVVSASKDRESFVSGKTVSLLLKNFDVANHGQTPVSASVYVKLADGTVIESAEYTYAMKDMVEQINDTYTVFSAAQLTAIAQMILRNDTMLDWRVENILGAVAVEYETISGSVSKESGVITAAADTLVLHKKNTLENGTYFAQINTTVNTNPAGIVFGANEDGTSYYLFRLGNGSKVELVKVVDGTETVVDTGYYPANRRKDVFSGMEIVVDGNTIHGYVYNPHYDRVHCFAVHQDTLAGNRIGLWSAAEGMVFQNISLTESTALRSAEVVIFGHSYTEMWTDYQTYFPEYPSIDNVGLGGSVAVQWEQFPEEIASYNPKLGIYMIGINDLTGSTTPKAVVASMEKTLLEIKALLPQFEVVVTAVNHCPNRATITDKISQCNALMRNLAASYDWIYYAETEYALCTDPSDPLSADSSLFSDGLHPNAAGYTILVEAIRSAAKGENQPAFDQELADQQLAEVKAAKLASLNIYGEAAYTAENWVNAKPYYDAAVAKINACKTEVQLQSVDLCAELAALDAIANKAAAVVDHVMDPAASDVRSEIKWTKLDDHTVTANGYVYSLDNTAVYADSEAVFKLSNPSAGIGTAGLLLRGSKGANLGMYGYLVNVNTNGNYIQIYYLNNSYNNDSTATITKYLGGIVLNNYGIDVVDTEFYAKIEGSTLYVNTLARHLAGEDNMVAIDLTNSGAYEVYEYGHTGILSWTTSTFDFQLKRYASEGIEVVEEEEPDLAAQIIANMLDPESRIKRSNKDWTKVDDHTIHAIGSDYIVDTTTAYSDLECTAQMTNTSAAISTGGLLLRANISEGKGVKGYLFSFNSNSNYIQVYHLNNNYNADSSAATHTYVGGIVLNNHDLTADNTQFYVKIEGSTMYINTVERQLAGTKMLATVDLTKGGTLEYYESGYTGMILWDGGDSGDLTLSNFEAK